MNLVIFLPAMGICLILDPNTKPSHIGTICVTPSPESTTTPVKVSIAFFWSLSISFPASSYVLEHPKRAKTAWTPIYNPGTLKVSKNISAMFSLFSGGFIGGSVKTKLCSWGSHLR